MPSQGPAASQPIAKSRHEKEEDVYRNPTTMSSSLQSNLPPRTSSHYQPTTSSRHEDAMYNSESTSTMPDSNQNYPAPSKGFEYPGRHQQEDTPSQSAGGISVNYRQTDTSIQLNEAVYKLAPSSNQSSSQPRYTERQRQDVETQILQLLRDRGHTTATQHDLDRLVNEQLGRLYGSQQQQYHQQQYHQQQYQQQQYQQTPVSSSQGQNPSSGSVPYTQYPEPGGQKPGAGSVPITQFPRSGSQPPPPGSVPYTQFPGSDKAPEATQPDYGGSYGFTTTSGGPRSKYVNENNDRIPIQASSQSHDSRSGKHTPRDAKYSKR